MKDEQEVQSKLEPLLVSMETVALLLEVSVRTVKRLLASNRLPEPIRLGGSIRWSIETLRNWVHEGCQSLDEGAVIGAATYGGSRITNRS